MNSELALPFSETLGRMWHRQWSRKPWDTMESSSLVWYIQVLSKEKPSTSHVKIHTMFAPPVIESMTTE